MMNLRGIFIGLLAISMSGATVGADPYATEVVSYTAGTNAQIGYDEPNTALGMPSLWVPGWPSGTQDVTMFAPAWTTEQLVSIGAGGSLVVKFDHQVMDDALNPFGMDFLIFGNKF